MRNKVVFVNSVNSSRARLISGETLHMYIIIYSSCSLHSTEIPNLEQVEDLLAEVQLKVCVVGARHVIDEHQAVPLSLKAA